MFTQDYAISNVPVSSDPVAVPEPEMAISIPSIGPAVEPEIEQPESIDLSKYYFTVCPNQIFSGDQQDKTLVVDLDIVIGCPNKTVKVTKRISLCKEKLAMEALSKDALLNMTSTYVEQKEESLINQRLLELAGVSHSKNFVKR